MSDPNSRVVIPGVNACDGWPKCRFETKDRKALKAHMRECAYSDKGGLYRVLRGTGR